MIKVTGYHLIAGNESGARMRFDGKTKKEVLMMFDTAYERKGFRLTLYKHCKDGSHEFVIENVIRKGFN